LFDTSIAAPCPTGAWMRCMPSQVRPKNNAFLETSESVYYHSDFWNTPRRTRNDTPTFHVGRATINAGRE
jgi:hypothetical protein